MKPARPIQDLIQQMGDEYDWVSLTKEERLRLAQHLGVYEPASFDDRQGGGYTSMPGHPAECWRFSSPEAFMSWCSRNGVRVLRGEEI